MDWGEHSAIQKNIFKEGEHKILMNSYHDNSDISKYNTKSKKMMEVFIPEGYEDFIRDHYGVVPRREIARELNLSKVLLNLMIIQLGLKETEGSGSVDKR